MFNVLSDKQIKELIDGELGINVIRFMEIVESMGINNTFVDLGVETGRSSKILLNNAIEKNNHVIGVDPIPAIDPTLLLNPNYTYVNADSVSTGENYGKDKSFTPSIIFVDSIHAKEQVLCELKSWWPLLKVNGWIIFHDTAWKGYIHKANHPCAGKLTGNTAKGYDTYGGIDWETPDFAVKEFFGLNELGQYEDKFIKVEHSAKDLGMTFIQKKRANDFSKYIANWKIVESRRNTLLKSFGA